MAAEQRAEAAADPTGRVFFFEDEHAAPPRDGEAPADGPGEGETKSLVDHVPALAEFLLAREPAAALVRQNVGDVGHGLGIGDGEEVAAALDDELAGRGADRL